MRFLWIRVVCEAAVGSNVRSVPCGRVGVLDWPAGPFAGCRCKGLLTFKVVGPAT